MNEKKVTDGCVRVGEIEGVVKHLTVINKATDADLDDLFDEAEQVKLDLEKAAMVRQQNVDGEDSPDLDSDEALIHKLDLRAAGDEPSTEPRAPRPKSISVTITGLQADAIRKASDALGFVSIRQFTIHLMDMGMKVHGLCGNGPLTGESFAHALWRLAQAAIFAETKASNRAVVDIVEEYEQWRQDDLLSTQPARSNTQMIGERPGRAPGRGV